MMKKIIALLLSLSLFLSVAPVFAGAAQGQRVVAGTSSANAGGSGSLTVKAENVTNIASMEVYLYYDPTVLTVTGTSNGSLLSGAQVSVNTGEAGMVKLVMMSLNGVSGSGNLLTVSYQIRSGCTPGSYPITVAVGGAYDTQLKPVTVGSGNGSVTVNAPAGPTETFGIYNYYSASTLKQGDVLTYRVASSSSSRSFVSGDFTVYYDSELFAFEEMVLETALTGAGAVYSVNSDIRGQVRLAYANTQPVKTFYLFSVKLRVVANVDTTTTVRAGASNMYREDLFRYAPGNATMKLTLQKKQEIVDHPNVFLQTEELRVGNQSKSVFYLEEGAAVAAGDFAVTYDPAVLRCVAVTMGADVEKNGGILIINDNFRNGSIRFSYVNMEAYAGELALVEITWEPISSPDAHYEMSIRGVGVVDPEQKPITLEYVTDSGCIFVPVVNHPTCLEGGYTDYTCGCGETYRADYTTPLGHDLKYIEACAPTCTQNGCSAHEGCTRCDYGTYEKYPALGHDEILHEAKAPTCLEIGWDSYVTCSRCDHSTYQERKALGHRVIGPQMVLADPVTVQNNGILPFEIIDGVYYSRNHENYSASEFTVTALHNCSVTLSYGVSSEANYDKLHLLKNGSQLDMISGTVLNQKRTVSLSSGDVLTVRYTKDAAVSNGEDRGWVKMEYEQVLVEKNVDIPMDTLEPDCANGLACDYCEVVITVPHTFVSGKCTLCGAPAPALFAANVKLETNLAIGYVVKKAVVDAYDQVYIKCICNGAETVITESRYDAQEEEYYFYFRNISPKSINDTVITYVYGVSNGVEYRSEGRAYSVATYCYNMLPKSAKDLKLRTLLVDLLNYGSAMQIYADYRTNLLANAGLTEEQKAWATASDRELETVLDTKFEMVESPMAVWAGASLVLTDSVGICYKLLPAKWVDVAGLTVKVKLESGGETVITPEEFTQNPDGTYDVYFDGMHAGQMSKAVYATAYLGDVPISHTVRYSVESYASRQQNSQEAGLAELVKAMMRYGDSAKAYTEA